MEIHQTDFDLEKDFLMDIYNSDQKNYHAWSYRLWLIERFGLWANELDFVEHEIKNGQVTNNTLWSYRYFITAKTKEFTKNILAEEIKYTMDQIENQDPDNEAAWVYLKGYLAQSPEEQKNSLNTNTKRWYIMDFPDLKERLEKLVQA